MRYFSALFIVISSFFLLGCSSTPLIKNNWLNLNIERHADLTFSKSSVHFVEKIGNNYFFRGRVPLTGKFPNYVFAYDDLVEEFEKVSQDKLPKNFSLIDISLLNPIIEENYIKVEQAFFQSNPTKGRFVHYPIVDPSHEKTDRIVDNIRSILTTQSDQPKVIYLHCEAGCDRTGFITAAYEMKFHQESLSQAKKINTDICGRKVNLLSEYLTKSYCKYLNTKNIKVSCEE